MTRSERKALKAVLADDRVDRAERALIRSQAFELARERLNHCEDGAVVDWLEEVVKALNTDLVQVKPGKAFFSPGTECLQAIQIAIAATRAQLDLCIFALSDDRIYEAILAAHQRGVAVRILSDDQKVEDRGADAYKLLRAGIEVRVDKSPAHMHHKFALFDRATLLTGSYNWTRSAATKNQENLVELHDPYLVKRFADEFERLWRELVPLTVD
jgi:phosphatidylserine/phosphatidylglycerophosphate/cardiolipin synthase-like enzyme